jgi:uncharacterized membrane protein
VRMLSGSGGSPRGQSSLRAPFDLDRPIARLLTMGTYLGVLLLAIGIVTMAAAGRWPLQPSGVPGVDLARLPGDLAAGRPEGFLWLGLLCVIATPSARVLASLIGYLRLGELSMVLVSVGILLVIAASVAIGLSGGGAR